MKREMKVNKLSIFRFRNADACELLCKKGGYSAGGNTGGPGTGVPPYRVLAP